MHIFNPKDWYSLFLRPFKFISCGLDFRVRFWQICKSTRVFDAGNRMAFGLEKMKSQSAGGKLFLLGYKSAEYYVFLTLRF